MQIARRIEKVTQEVLPEIVAQSIVASNRAHPDPPSAEGRQMISGTLSWVHFFNPPRYFIS